jgi:hypothetical protein
MAAAGGEFDAALRSGPQLTFEMGGRTWHCRRRLPFGLIGNLAARLDEGGLPVFHAFADLVVMAVVKDEREAFREMVFGDPDDDDLVVDFADMAQAARRICEHATGSPFGSASGSVVTPLPAGATSRGPAGSGASTSPRHRHVKL